MSMMIAGTIASAALGLVGAAAQTGQANAAYQAQVEASNQQLALVYEENERLRGEVDEQALEAKSDRVRALNHELGALRATREFGLTGNALTRMMVQSSYTAGLDLSRIESNRKAEQGAITASNKRGHQAAINDVRTARNQRRATVTNAWLSAVGSGLQIGTSYYGQRQVSEAAKNKAT